MKNIAIFINDLHVGGIQKSVVNLLKNIDKKKYNIDLYVFDKDSFYDVPDNANIIYLNKPAKIYKFLPFNIVKHIMKINVLNKEYDVSIDFDSYQMHTAIGALNCNSKKKVIWIHNDISIKLKEELKYRILYFFFKKKYQYFDTFTAVSKGALDSFEKLHSCEKKKCYIIPNYINTKEIKERMKEKSDIIVDKNKINIVTVGRLCHQKGIDIMLERIKELTEYRNDFHLYIIGDGVDREKLESLVDELNIKHYVSFLGNKKNPFKYLKEMDLFYLSSRYEGQGMVILEAMSVGLDILILEHLEKYCPSVKGTKDVIGYLKDYKKPNEKKFNDLRDYNNNITKEINNLFSGN